MRSPKLALCIITAVLLSCSTAPRHSSPPALTPPRMLALWEVSREGEPTSHLLGTCHNGVTLDQALPRQHQKLITDASVFVTEVDLRELDSGTVDNHLRLPEGKTLSGFVGEDKWAAIVETANLGDAAEALNQRHPFYISVFVNEKMTQRLNPGTLGMDAAVDQIATKAGVRGEFLATPEEHVAVITQIPLEDWIRELSRLPEPDFFETGLRAADSVLQVCRTGDLLFVDKALEESREDSPAFSAKLEQRLLTERNLRWMPKLDALFQEGPTFVAVGAAHMVGNDGLLKLLEARGYQVTQLWGRTEIAPRLVQSELSQHHPPVAFTENMAETLASSLCAVDGIVLQCSDTRESACRDIVRISVRACAEAAELSSEEPDPGSATFAESIGECVGSGVLNAIAPLPSTGSPGCEESLARLAAN